MNRLVPRAWLAARLPLAVFALALLPRLIDLGRRPFWLDEVFTLQRAMLAPAALVKDSFANHHMPSYFLMLSPFIALGHPQFWLRLPSAAFGALAVMLVFVIGSRIAGRKAGLIAALILGLSPSALAFSQEARSYTLEMCLILVALYGLLELALDAPAASVPLGNPGAARRGWALFVVGSAAALDVLGDGLPWIVTANVIALVMLRLSPNPRGLLRNLLLGDLVITLLCAPFYLIMLATQASRFSDSVKWIPALNLDRFWYDIGSVYLMRIADSVSFDFMDVATPKIVSWAIDTGLLLGIALAGWRLRRRPAVLAALVLSFALLPSLFALVSLWRPILLPRYILWSAGPFAVLAGIGVAYVIGLLPRRGQMIAIAGAAVILLANMLPYYGAETKPRWDIAAQLLARDVAPGDVVFLNDKGALPLLRVYLPPGAQAAVLADSDGDLAHARQAQAQGRRVWAVFGNAGQSAEQKAWPAFYAKLATLGTPEQIQVAGSRIYISLFNPANRAVSENCVQSPVASAQLSEQC